MEDIFVFRSQTPKHPQTLSGEIRQPFVVRLSVSGSGGVAKSSACLHLECGRGVWKQ